MKIVFEGREWELDLEAITLKQGVAMHLAYGYTLDAWLEAVGETDPRALQCLWWLMLQQDGQVIAIKDADCAIVKLAAAFADAQEEEEAPAEPGPTSPPSTNGGPPLSVPQIPATTTPLPVPQEGGRAIAYTPAI